MYNAKIKNIDDKIPDITNLATKATLNAKSCQYLVLFDKILSKAKIFITI